MMKKSLVALVLAGSLNIANAQVDKNYKNMEYTLIGLNALDYISTLDVLNHGGGEKNPNVKGFINNPYKAIGFKVGLVGGSLAGLRWVYKDDPKLAKRYLKLANVMYGVIVSNNLKVSINLRRRQNR